MTSPALAAPALAAAKPTITRLTPGSGPVQPTEVAITGKNLQGVTAVRFGDRAGVVVDASTNNAILVRTPVGARTGTVSVRVRTAAGWSSVSKKARYVFLPTPKVTRISPKSGYYSGGTKVTLTGQSLDTATGVTFGGQPATMVSRKAKTLVVRTPIGVLGPVPVAVTTRGGTAVATRLTFTYTDPPDQSKLQLAAATQTHVAAAVEWVTGGHNEETGAPEPWQVGLPKGATVPTVGQQFLLRPGNPVFVSGLAGTVTEVADQLDATVRITVAPSDLDAAVTGLSLDYSGPVVDPTATVGGRAAVTAGRSFAFPLKGSTALLCRDPDGQSVTFGADLTVEVSDVDVDQHLDLGSLVRRPSYDAALTAELRTTGKITVAAAATCEPKPAWVNANRKVVPLGTSGATISFGPSFKLDIDAKGTWTVTDRTRTTFGVHAAVGAKPTYTRTSRSVESAQRGDLTFTVTMTGGVSVQFGLLDRAGLQGKVLLGVTATAAASTTPSFCLTAEIFGEVQIGVFLDVWVDRWDSDAFTARIPIKAYRTCHDAEPPAPSGEPEITSARLPDATIAQPYSAALTTADARPGTWTIVRPALPAGLTLAADGSITGTPQGPVGDHPVIVDFKDATGRVATTTVRIMVRPGQTLGGGDIQATLRWAGAADLDLHVLDPSGEEIYYRHTESSSGGRLDHDANAACNGAADDDNPVENVYWPTGKAPNGSYTVWVKVYAACGAPLDWQLSVRRNGATVVQQTGTGDSTAYSFTLGTGAAASAMRPGPAPVSQGGPKTRG